MSQDPYSDSGATPEPQEPTPNPYDIPPPQNPYDIPPPSPSQNPYDIPPPSQSPNNNPPPQNPYDLPPPQSPYGYGPPPQAPYGYAPPPSYERPEIQSAPLPLGEAIRQLPQQYIKVLTKPSALTFAEEMGKASWDITWVQLLGLAVIEAILTLISYLTTSALYRSGTNATLSPAALQAIMWGTSIGLIVFIPLSFFIHQGITYLIAKGFGGIGTFLRQAYTSILIQVPLGIISAVISVIFSFIPIAGPILGSLIALAAGVYEIVLLVFSIMAVHRLTGGKATGVVLLPLLIIFVVVCVLGVLFAALLAVASRTTSP